jgi:hypothetical protein
MAGFNFRKTDTYVADPVGTVCVTTTPDSTYPITKLISGVSRTYGSLVAGIEPGGNYYQNANRSGFSRDRKTTGDVRFAGTQQVYSSGRVVLQIDLLSVGLHEIRLAAGDHSYGKKNKWRILDNGVVLHTSAETPSAAAKYMDATGVVRNSEADWVANNQSIQLNFTTTAFQIEVYCYDPSVESALVHLSVLKVETLIPAKALILSAGELKQISSGELGTGKKPVVIDAGSVKQRSASEGKALVLAGGSTRGILSSESLQL